MSVCVSFTVEYPEIDYALTYDVYVDNVDEVERAILQALEDNMDEYEEYNGIEINIDDLDITIHDVQGDNDNLVQKIKECYGL